MSQPTRPRRRPRHAPIPGETFESVEAFEATLALLRMTRIGAETDRLLIQARHGRITLGT